MKKCPFCAEEIQDEAIKCKHCGEFLDGRILPASAQPIAEPKPLWYTRTGIIVTCLLSIGPLGLPLVWIHPTWSLLKKTTITVVVILVTLWLWQSVTQAMKQLQGTMSSLGISL